MIKKDFIRRAIDKHGERYIYDLIPEEFKVTDEIPIICKEHGIFHQIARNHVNNGDNCPECARIERNRKLTMSFEDFVKKEKEVHGDKYEVIKESYGKANDKLKIRCNVCGGIFEQKGTMHLSGRGCPYCHPFPRKLTHKEFVNKLSETHPNLEVLSEYKGKDEKITVRCKIHDYVYQTTPHRLVQGANCKKCYDDRRGKTRIVPPDVVMENILKIHGDNYTFPNFHEEYRGSHYNVTAICTCGRKFKITVNKLLIGQGCRSCGNKRNGEKHRLTINDFYDRAKKHHNIKYIYPNIEDEYQGWDSVITVICPKHGEFKQIAGIHMSGCGCPKCNESKLEREMNKIFPEAECYKRFEWLGWLSLDLYIPDKKIAIECQGYQHFRPSKKFGGEDGFNKRLENDIRKNNLCKENGVRLIYVLDKKNKYLINDDLFEGIYNKDTYLIEDIKNDVISFKKSLLNR